MRLVPFTEDDLPAVRTWFDDPETRRWLGHDAWPQMILRLAAVRPGDHRGHGVVDRRPWIIEEAEVRVGLLDVERYDDRTASLAFVVAPTERGRGVGRRALEAIAAQLAADGIREVFGGVETDNVASIRSLEAAGFTRRSAEPDAEGFLYFARQLQAAGGDALSHFIQPCGSAPGAAGLDPQPLQLRRLRRLQSRPARAFLLRRTSVPL